MILVELTELSHRYGPTMYVVGTVNCIMYGMFDRGFRVISENATLRPTIHRYTLSWNAWVCTGNTGKHISETDPADYTYG